MFDQRAGGHFLRQRIVFRALIDTEIGSSEQLLNQDNLRALAVRVTYQTLSVGNVFFQFPGAGHLSSGNRYISHERLHKSRC